MEASTLPASSFFTMPKLLLPPKHLSFPSPFFLFDQCQACCWSLQLMTSILHSFRSLILYMSTQVYNADAFPIFFSVVEDLYKRRQPMPTMEAIYFMQPLKEKYFHLEFIYFVLSLYHTTTATMYVVPLYMHACLPLPVFLCCVLLHMCMILCPFFLASLSEVSVVS